MTEQKILERVPAEALKTIHRKIITDMDLPAWAFSMKCPECGEVASAEGTRSISLKLNAANLGDLVVETLCPKCHACFDMHYRGVVRNLKDLLRVLCADGEGTSSVNVGWNPVLSTDIPSGDNRLLEIAKDQIDEILKKGQVEK